MILENGFYIIKIGIITLLMIWMSFTEKYYFLDFNDVMSVFNLIKVIKFPTWSRLVGTEFRSSILDHVFIRDPTEI